MGDWIKAGCSIILYLFLFWSFGSGFACLCSRKQRPVGERIVAGFFLYYACFQVIAIPMMFAQRRLSELGTVWLIFIAAVCAGAFIIRRKMAGNTLAVWRGQKAAREKEEGGAFAWFWRYMPAAVAMVNILFVLLVYSNYWDATYYVGNVSFAVYTDSINTIDPLTGTLLDSFDLKHCLATYHVQDAVFCQLFGIHPLVETKTIMAAVVTVVLNLTYYEFGRFLFDGNVRARGLFQGFAFLINLCTYTAFTSSSFILLRAYEGKAVTGAVTAVFLLYLFLHLWSKEDAYYWRALFITAWGAVSISSSALFLVILSVGVFALVKVWKSRRFREWLWCGICMAPAFFVLLCYLLNRLGILIVPIRR